MDQETTIKAYMFGGFMALIIVIIAFGVYSLWSQAQHAIHGDAVHEGTTQVATAAVAPAPSKESSHPGQALIAKSDCRTCHLNDKKLIGPSYMDVAARYTDESDDTIQTLVHKVKAGGQGNWGNIPMTPHTNLSDADIRKMVEYVLSLND